MPTAVLTILKLCLLAVIYLFLLRVVRAVWMELRASGTGPDGPEPARERAASRGRATPRGRAAPGAPGAGSGDAPGGSPGRRRGGARAAAVELRVVEPPDRRGTVHPLTGEVTIGRAPGCGVRVEDTFASQLHARVFTREGRWYVEDLGSTNGTWLNRKRVHGPLPMSNGDRIAVGDTVLEFRR
jgi:hypothetical protein